MAPLMVPTHNSVKALGDNLNGFPWSILIRTLTDQINSNQINEQMIWGQCWWNGILKLSAYSKDVPDRKRTLNAQEMYISHLRVFWSSQLLNHAALWLFDKVCIHPLSCALLMNSECFLFLYSLCPAYGGPWNKCWLNKYVLYLRIYFLKKHLLSSLICQTLVIEKLMCWYFLWEFMQSGDESLRIHRIEQVKKKKVLRSRVRQSEE